MPQDTLRIEWRCTVMGDAHRVHLSAANSLMFAPMCCCAYMEPVDVDQWAALDAARINADRYLGLFGVTLARLLQDACAEALMSITNITAVQP